jgi:hypothetical protein
LSEVEEMELTSEALTLSSEEELDHFLGGLFNKVAKSAGRFMKSKVGRSLTGALKGIAKKALPIAGAAVGTAIAPGIGTALGGALGGAASNMFEFESDGMTPDEKGFETARRFVRFAGVAARNALSGRDDARPERLVQSAILQAARRHAPGLLRRLRRMGPPPPRRHEEPARDEGDHGSEQAVSGEWEGDEESLTPQEEMEAASDLLGANNEFDVQNVVGNVLKKAVRRNGAFLKKGVAGQLGGALKGVAMQAVPGVARAISGGDDSDPTIRTARDAIQLARSAGKLFGLEFEGMSPEDKEFEAARRVVKLASAAGARAAQASRTGAPASQIARTAMVDAAKEHAPGLLARPGQDRNGASGQDSRRNGDPSAAGAGTAKRASGRWIRKGSHILLIGAGA